MKKDCAGLEVTLLGGFEVRLATGQPVTLSTRKAQALLAYLATRPGQPHARDKLTALLWADRGDAQARDSLRHTLVELRKALPAPVSPTAERGAIVLNTVGIEVDVARFEARAAVGSAAELAEAADIYQGDFLDGFVLREPLFEAWLVAERERLLELAMGTLGQLLEQQCAVREAEPAIRTALRLLALDAGHERAHRALMQLYAQQGRRAAALRQYQTYAGMLRRELRTEPDAETRRLYLEIVRCRDEVPGGARRGARRSVAAPGQPVAVRPEPGSAETPLVGRDTELATLCTALDEARWGRGRMVAIIGEAGIGKTRLVAELVRTAEAHDTQVLTARCYETEQILRFGPWVDALRAARVVPADPALLALEPAWRAELARLFPELAAADLPAPTDETRRLFESVTQLIRSLAMAQPVLVVLEDVHWADEMTVRLAAFLGRRILGDRVLVAMTAREEELVEADGLRRALSELRGSGHIAELALAQLSRPDTARLVGCLMPPGSDAQVMERVEEHAWAASAGNPFVVLETVRALRGGLTLPAGPRLALPSRVREIIAERVERVSDHGRQLLSVAAVIGRAFDFAWLQRASGLSEHAAAEGVEELVRRRLLHAVSDGLDVMHERIREAVYGTLLPPRRTLLHRDVATARDALRAGALDRPAAAPGLHYGQPEVVDHAVVQLRQAGGRRPHEAPGGPSHEVFTIPPTELSRLRP
jgi:DNA-binding SARP family transcriptional activator